MAKVKNYKEININRGDLQKSDKQYREMVENFPEMVVEIDLEGRVNYANKAALAKGGYSKNDLSNGLNILEMVIPDDRIKLSNSLKNLFSGKIITKSEYNIIKKDGTTFPVFSNPNFILDIDGVVIGLRAVLMDVSDMKKAEETLIRNHIKLKKTLTGTLDALAAAVETRDPYTSGHQKRVTNLSVKIANELGLEESVIDNIRNASLVHDIGKINVPMSILSKPGKISEIEFSLIKEHPIIGFNIIKKINFHPSVAKMIIQHHERINGSGYPYNLTEDEIILGAKIIAIADVVEAMSSDRPYRATLGIDKALMEINKGKGIIYDSKIVETCLKVLSEKKLF